MEQILPALGQVFSPGVLLVMAVGTLLGITLGAIPGLTPTMSVAVLVPFTFTMEPAAGLVLLGAVYGGSVYGGSISAVLLNIPGAPANLATTWDGYPMAKRGEGARAIQLSVAASVIGGLVGFGSLLFLAPPLARISLAFGPPESFWLAVFGITIIASLASANLIKGLVSGAFGVLLGTVGVSTATGMTRYVFDIATLRAGVGLVAGLIGLFAINQTLQTIEHAVSGHRPEVIPEQTAGPRDAMRQLLRNTFEACRKVRFWVLGSVLGTIIGVIPGAGGQVAGPITYDQGKRIAKNRDEWGHGASEGVVSAESGNAGMVGGSLVPMMTLGIPGSPTAAVLLGGLIIHGMFPGADLFDRHADVAYIFMVGMIVTQFFLLVIATAGAPLYAKVLEVPVHYLAPAILVISLFGAYAVRRNLGDVIFAVGIGVAMYLAMKLRFDPASAVLGLVLGPIAETNIILSIRAAQAHGDFAGYFLTRPISVFFIVLIVASIVATALQRRRTRRTARAEQVVTASDDRRWGRRNVMTGAALVAFAGLAYIPMHGERWEHAIWPVFTLGIIALLGVLLVGQGLVQRRRGAGADGPSAGDEAVAAPSGDGTRERDPAVAPGAASGATALTPTVVTSAAPAPGGAPANADDGLTSAARRRMVVMVAAFVAYLAMAIYVGFYEATLLFLVATPFVVRPGLHATGWRKRLTPVVYAVLTVVVLFLAFERFMRVLIPSTLLG